MNGCLRPPSPVGKDDQQETVVCARHGGFAYYFFNVLIQATSTISKQFMNDMVTIRISYALMSITRMVGLPRCASQATVLRERQCRCPRA